MNGNIGGAFSGGGVLVVLREGHRNLNLHRQGDQDEQAVVLRAGHANSNNQRGALSYSPSTIPAYPSLVSPHVPLAEHDLPGRTLFFPWRVSTHVPLAEHDVFILDMQGIC